MPHKNAVRVTFKFRDIDVTYGVVEDETGPRLVVFPDAFCREVLRTTSDVGGQVAKDNNYRFPVAGLARGGICNAMYLKHFDDWRVQTLQSRLCAKHRKALNEVADLPTAIREHADTGRDWTAPAPTAVVTYGSRTKIQSAGSVADPMPSAVVTTHVPVTTVRLPLTSRDVPTGTQEIPVLRAKEIGTVNYRNLFFCRVVMAEDCRVYVALNDISRGLMMGDEREFRERIVSRFPKGVCRIPLPSGSGEQLTTCLELKYTPGAVITISINHVAEEKRQYVADVQENLFDVLADYEFTGNASNPAFSQEERDEARLTQDSKINQMSADVRGLLKATENIAQAVVATAKKVEENEDSVKQLSKKVDSLDALVMKVLEDKDGQTAKEPDRVAPAGSQFSLEHFKSAEKIAEHYLVEKEAVRTLLLHYRMVDDRRYGGWAPVEINGKHVKDNWVTTPEAAEFLAPDLVRYRECLQGLNNKTHRSPRSAAEGFMLANSLTPFGRGTATKLDRKAFVPRKRPSRLDAPVTAATNVTPIRRDGQASQ